MEIPKKDLFCGFSPVGPNFYIFYNLLGKENIISMGRNRIMNVQNKVLLLFTIGIVIFTASIACLFYIVFCTLGHSLLAVTFFVTILIFFSALFLFFLQRCLNQHYIVPLHYLSQYAADYQDISKEMETVAQKNEEIRAIYLALANLKDQNNDLVRKQYQNRLSILQAKMKALESQVSAHFLNNTLEAINSIAEIEQIPPISIMALSLGKMYGYSIRTAGELTTLRGELEHLRNYIAISEIRFPNKFKTEYSIDESLLSTPTLKLILQPIVENAVCHGLNPCSNTDGLIHISVNRLKNDLLIQIWDNGVGMSKEKLDYLRSSINDSFHIDERDISEARHIGLRNVNSRIQLYYGRHYGISIESRDGLGTSVTVRIPIMGGVHDV